MFFLFPGMYFDATEIVPFVMGQYRFNKDDEVVSITFYHMTSLLFSG